MECVHTIRRLLCRVWWCGGVGGGGYEVGHTGRRGCTVGGMVPEGRKSHKPGARLNSRGLALDSPQSADARLVLECMR